MTELLIAVFFLLGTGWLAMFTCCCGCVCVHCSDGPAKELEVVISGVTNFVCLDCADFNGTYIVACEGAANCVWKLATSLPCSEVEIVVTLSFDGLDYKLTCGTLPETSFALQKNFGASQPDCNTWLSLDLNTTKLNGNDCIGTTATILVTSQP